MATCAGGDAQAGGRHLDVLRDGGSLQQLEVLEHESDSLAAKLRQAVLVQLADIQVAKPVDAVRGAVQTAKYP